MEHKEFAPGPVCTARTNTIPLENVELYVCAAISKESVFSFQQSHRSCMLPYQWTRKDKVDLVDTWIRFFLLNMMSLLSPVPFFFQENRVHQSSSSITELLRLGKTLKSIKSNRNLAMLP